MGHSKPIYKWNLQILTNLIIHTLNKKFDFVIAIEGHRGLGKSTLAWHIARRLHHSPERIKGTYVFTPERDLLFSQNAFLDALLKRWREAYISDEAINTVFNRDFYNEQQKKIIKALNMNRDHLNCIIMCVPSFTNMDTQIKALCKMRITVIRRGLAIIHTPVKSIYSKDVWDTAHNEKIERDWLKGNSSKPKYSRLTTFRGFLSFPDLTEKQRELYEKLKVQKRNELMVEEEDKKDGKGKNALDKVPTVAIATKLLTMMQENKIATKEEFVKLCVLMGKKPDNVRSTINQQLEEAQVKERFKDFFKKKSVPTDEMPMEEAPAPAIPQGF